MGQVKEVAKRGLKPVNNLYFRSAQRLAPSIKPLSSPQRSVFIAPHQDDEVLGCGGIMTIHRRLGWEINVIYLSDGQAKRHPPHLSSADFGSLRKEEARQAMDIIGVRSENIHFFDLEEDFPSPDEPVGVMAIDRIAKLLERLAPDEVFLPYRLDPNIPHMASFKLVEAALTRSKVQPVRCEYPVSLWGQRPWFWRMPAGWRRRLRKVDVRQALSVKEQAVAAYRTLTTSMFGDGSPPLLSADRLRDFLCGYEYFFVDT